MTVLNRVTMNGLQDCFQKWYYCWQRCIMAKGRYFIFDVQAGLPFARSAEFVALFLGLVDHTLYIGSLLIDESL